MEFSENFLFSSVQENGTVTNDLWESLRSCQKSVLLYGMGNGADKIIATCERKGIDICDCFASDGFVRGQLFHGRRVLSFSEAKDKYRDSGFVALLSFGSFLPDVMDKIRQVGKECELYAPDVPVFGDTLFDMTFCRQNFDRLQSAYELMTDDISKHLFADMIRFKLTGNLRFLTVTDQTRQTIYRDLLRAEHFSSYLDLGAYNGDTVRELLTAAPSLQTAYAWEPDRRSFAKLQAYAESETRCRVIPLQCGAWSKPDTLTFDDSGNRNASILENASADIKGRIRRTTAIAVEPPDHFLRDRDVDFIKYDVEGAEHEALIGTRQTIADKAPALWVSAYHRSEDLFDLPLLLHELQPAYRLYLRRTPYIPAWDLHLIAIR